MTVTSKAETTLGKFVGAAQLARQLVIALLSIGQDELVEKAAKIAAEAAESILSHGDGLDLVEAQKAAQLHIMWLVISAETSLALKIDPKKLS